MISDIKHTIRILLTLSSLLAISLINADDTEVFYSINVSKPNLLFVLDNSGSMKLDLNGNEATIYDSDLEIDIPNPDFTPPNRLSILQQAVQTVIAEAPDNINVGLMRFGPGMIDDEWYTENEGQRTHGVNGVAFPLTDINTLAREVIPTAADVYGLPHYPNANETVRSYVSEVVNNWTATGGTPLVGAIYEAALYFRGERMRYGLDIPAGVTGVGAHPATYSGDVIASDVSLNERDYTQAPTYISPITSSCQSNYIVLMSDGKPTYYYWGDANTQNTEWAKSRGPFAQVLQGNLGSSNLSQAIMSCVDSPSGYTAGKCGPEITRYLADNDNSSALDGIQTIKTYTIGFGANLTPQEQSYLRSMETIDDDPETGRVEDGYFSATQPDDLAAIFKDILDEVVEPKGTLASPGYSVNVKSGLAHERSIYIPVFDRKNTSRWSGNLKKFKLATVGNRRLIHGKNDLEATDELGGFTNDAFDLWSGSSTPDGKDILKGGVADKLTDPTIRKLYSNITLSNDLTSSGNLLKEDNTISIITNDLLDISSESTLDDRKKIINYIRGWQDGIPAGTARGRMGDTLHSEPYIHTYSSGEQVIFTATNEGFLHAFDTETGNEKFAFMPKELLKNIAPQMHNMGTAKDHLYGIDGPINLWNDTTNGKVYLYLALRRGGRSYYALDVTNVDSPQFAWKVNNEDTGYSKLGQSWSAPYLGTVGIGADGEKKEVVIFSAGYDPIEDRDLVDKPKMLNDSTVTVATTMGNDIFITNARSGGVPIWSLQGEFPDVVTDSIPGGVRYLDTNYNGKIDRMYFADTGGHVWRLDLSENIGTTPSKLVLLASLAGSGVDSRKFYNEPDVAVMKLKGKMVFVISIGSGFRAHPLDKSINDKFYMLVDRSPYKPIDTDNYITIRNNHLATISISDNGSGASIILSNKTIKDNNRQGWKVNFPEIGEKVLSNALAFDGIMTFTTLIPDPILTGAGIDQCAAPAVQGRFYAINILTGKAGLYLNSVEPGPDSPDAGQEIPDSEIRTAPISKRLPGSPQVIFNDLEVGEDGSCKHPVDIRIGKKLSQVTGYDACRLESVYWSDPVKK